MTAMTLEEMLAIREQYEERLAEERGRREEIEWQLRLEIARIRDAELNSRRAADGLRQVDDTLRGILERLDPAAKELPFPKEAPRRRMPPPPPKRSAIHAILSPQRGLA